MHLAQCYPLLRMALDHKELKRRLIAARELHGFDQAEMGRRLKKSGLGATDAKRLERNLIPLTDSHLDAYVRITELPAAWFTADDWRPLISANVGGRGSIPDDLTELRDEMFSAVERVRKGLNEIQANLPKAPPVSSEQPEDVVADIEKESDQDAHKDGATGS